MPRSALSLDLEGGPELERALLALGKKVATRIGRKAVRDPTRFLQAEMTLVAPYLEGARPGRSGQYGHLRDNLKVVSVRSKAPGLLLYRVTTGNAFWGNFLEFGTVNIAAQPWMRPTVDRNTSRIITMQIQVLKTGIEQEAKREARRRARAA
jgi:HK97 gp10 family phage protein